MIPHLSAELFVSIEADEIEGRHYGRSTLINLPAGRRISAGHPPCATRGEALYTALESALRHLPSEGEAHVILPDHDYAPFHLTVICGKLVRDRLGKTEFYSNYANYGGQEAFLAASNRWAEAEAHHGRCV